MKKLRLSPNTVVVFQAGTITKEGLINFGNAVQEQKIGGIILLVVDDITKVEALSEEDMNKLGWFKVNTLKRIMKDIENKQDSSGTHIQDNETLTSDNESEGVDE